MRTHPNWIVKMIIGACRRNCQISYKAMRLLCFRQITAGKYENDGILTVFSIIVVVTMRIDQIYYACVMCVLGPKIAHIVQNHTIMVHIKFSFNESTINDHYMMIE